VACPPGGGHVLDGAEYAGLHILERPLRARHINAIAQRESPAHSLVRSHEEPLRGLRVLAAEDNEINRLVLEDLLRETGAQLVSVKNGREAVERVQCDGPGAWDLVLMDVQMPEMDGYVATRLLRGVDPCLPVVGLTAHAMVEERDRCLAAGMVGHMAKPYDVQRLDARFPGGAAFVDRLAARVLEGHGGASARLRELAASADYRELALLEHGLKSMLGNLLAEEPRVLAAAMETAARDGESAALDLAEGLAESMERLLAALAKRLAAVERGGHR
jgi:CheY-like chemotaxis protein